MDDLGNFHQHFRNSSPLRGHVAQVNRGGVVCALSLIGRPPEHGADHQVLQVKRVCFDVSGSLLWSSDDQARTCSVNDVLISALVEVEAFRSNLAASHLVGCKIYRPEQKPTWALLSQKKTNKAANKRKFDARGFLPEGTFAFFGVSDKDLGKQACHDNSVNILGK